MCLKRLLLVLLPAVLLFSCSTTTGVFTDPYTFSSASMDEKLVRFGGEKVSVPLPECYYNGGLWLERLEELVEESEDYIFISTFLGSSSTRLEPFYDLLAEKARDGVDVYIIIDGLSSYDMTETKNHMTQLYFLRDSGVHLIEYAPVSVLRVINPASLIVRDHRKLFVFDGKKCAIGGMNLNYISLGAPDDKLQRDSMYLFDSPALSSLFMGEFIKIWNMSSVEKIDASLYPTYGQQGDGPFYDAYLFNQGPGGSGNVASMYASLINGAEESIDMLPYLPIWNDDMYSSIRNAVKRGVKVRIFFPLDSRSYAESGVKYVIPDIVATGAEVFISIIGGEDSLPMLHEKLMVVDGRYTVIGSTNFNYRSMDLSHEDSLVIDSRQFAEASTAHFNDRMAEGAMRIDEETAERWKEDSSFLSYLMVYYGG